MKSLIRIIRKIWIIFCSRFFFHWINKIINECISRKKRKNLEIYYAIHLYLIMPLFMKERKTRFRKKVSTVWGSPRPPFTSLFCNAYVSLVWAIRLAVVYLTHHSVIHYIMLGIRSVRLVQCLCKSCLGYSVSSSLFNTSFKTNSFLFSLDEK